MTSQEEIDLKNCLIDEICLHPEIYDKCHEEHSNCDRHISIFDRIVTLLGIPIEYLFYIFHRTMQKAHVGLIYRPF